VQGLGSDLGEKRMRRRPPGAFLVLGHGPRQIEQRVELPGQTGSVEGETGALDGAGKPVNHVDEARVPGFEIAAIEAQPREPLAAADGAFQLGQGRQSVFEPPAARHLHLQNFWGGATEAQACS